METTVAHHQLYSPFEKHKENLAHHESFKRILIKTNCRKRCTLHADSYIQYVGVNHRHGYTIQL